MHNVCCLDISESSAMFSQNCVLEITKMRLFIMLYCTKQKKLHMSAPVLSKLFSLLICTLCIRY